MTTLPKLYLVRHGETAWSMSHRHTGRTDVPLTRRGEREALAVARTLKGLGFGLVLTSPLIRAHRTCELAGLAREAQMEPAAAEWDYGTYEGMTTQEIHLQQPGWRLFRDGCPEGESPAQVGARADRVLDRIRSCGGDALIFSHGHFLRALAARWLGLSAEFGQFLLLSTAAVSVLSFEHNREEPALLRWNDTHHLD
jgi:broad specificity phosphatase PhoE